jgi:large subunit ribosomal protein L24
MQKIRKGDEVIAIAGKNKGQRGTVLRILADDQIVVEGLNRVKKHQRPNPMRGQVGGIVEKELPLHISNIALFNAVAGKGDRVGIKTLQDGRRVRFFRSNGEVIDR